MSSETDLNIYSHALETLVFDLRFKKEKTVDNHMRRLKASTFIKYNIEFPICM